MAYYSLQADFFVFGDGRAFPRTKEKLRACNSSRKAAI